MVHFHNNKIFRAIIVIIIIIIIIIIAKAKTIATKRPNINHLSKRNNRSAYNTNCHNLNGKYKDKM